jgi:hypothetical protein
MSAKRLDEAESKRLTDAAVKFQKRFKDQIPAPGGEALVRRVIEEIRTGSPNYDLMSPDMAKVIRQQLPTLQSSMVTLGKLQSVAFKGVGPGGADIYTCKFENGAVEYRIWLGTDGKLESANMRPVQM